MSSDVNDSSVGVLNLFCSVVSVSLIFIGSTFGSVASSRDSSFSFVSEA